MNAGVIVGRILDKMGASVGQTSLLSEMNSTEVKSQNLSIRVSGMFILRQDFFFLMFRRVYLENQVYSCLTVYKQKR